MTGSLALYEKRLVSSSRVYASGRMMRTSPCLRNGHAVSGTCPVSVSVIDAHVALPVWPCSVRYVSDKFQRHVAAAAAAAALHVRP